MHCSREEAKYWEGSNAEKRFCVYSLVYSIAEYVDMDFLHYIKAPGPSCGAEGDGGTARPPYEVRCVVSLFPLV